MPDAINAAAPPADLRLGAGPPPVADPFAGMDSQAFLRLLVAQLRYQNPMQPSDPTAMLQQTSQLRQVESLGQVAQLQAQMVSMHQASMAAGLVGRTVTAVDLDGTTVEGLVEAVRFTPVGPVLVVGGRQVPLDATAEIGTAPHVPPPVPLPTPDPAPVAPPDSPPPAAEPADPQP
jgi:flagellar basal-body rod modification protein FlgD